MLLVPLASLGVWGTCPAVTVEGVLVTGRPWAGPGEGRGSSIPWHSAHLCLSSSRNRFLLGLGCPRLLRSPWSSCPQSGPETGGHGSHLPGEGCRSKWPSVVPPRALRPPGPHADGGAAAPPTSFLSVHSSGHPWFWVLVTAAADSGALKVPARNTHPRLLCSDLALLPGAAASAVKPTLALPSSQDPATWGQDPQDCPRVP